MDSLAIANLHSSYTLWLYSVHTMYPYVHVYIPHLIYVLYFILFSMYAYNVYRLLYYTSVFLQIYFLFSCAAFRLVDASMFYTCNKC